MARPAWRQANSPANTAIAHRLCLKPAGSTTSSHVHKRLISSVDNRPATPMVITTAHTRAAVSTPAYSAHVGSGMNEAQVPSDDGGKASAP